MFRSLFLFSLIVHRRPVLGIFTIENLVFGNL